MALDRLLRRAANTMRYRLLTTRKAQHIIASQNFVRCWLRSDAHLLTKLRIIVTNKLDTIYRVHHATLLLMQI